jgi:hypothetical protein
MSMDDRRFPIIDRRYGLPKPGDQADPVRSVPWSLVEPLRARCLLIHSQTLERLADRGGLGPEELWAHVQAPEPFASRDWWRLVRARTPDELRAWLRTLGAQP